MRQLQALRNGNCLNVGYLKVLGISMAGQAVLVHNEWQLAILKARLPVPARSIARFAMTSYSYEYLKTPS